MNGEAFFLALLLQQYFAALTATTTTNTAVTIATILRPAPSFVLRARRASGPLRCFASVKEVARRSAPRALASVADTPAMSSTIASALANVQSRIDFASLNDRSVRLVAVSKTKPLADLLVAYEAGQRVFGENYVQEIVGKAPEMPEGTLWHFIGPIQSNKAAALVKGVGRSLVCVETVSTTKLASKLNNAAAELNSDTEPFCLGIYLQVNTSGEDSKSGLIPSDTPAFAKEIVDSFTHLHLRGLMTIGAPGDLACFDTLVDCRTEVAKVLGIAEVTLELSMGMSGDYEEAIARGATNVRVGSTIFGARDYSNKK